MDREIHKPVIIVSPGRSGSSYVAGQFHKAGLWGGVLREGDRHNPQGYFENTRIHRGLREWYGREWVTGAFPDEKPGWHLHLERILAREQYPGGPWFFKGGAFYWKCFQSFDPVYVKVWRDRESILKSFKRTQMLKRHSEKDMEIIVDRQHAAMKAISGLDIHI